jgi:hypothetical protein
VDPRAGLDVLMKIIFYLYRDKFSAVVSFKFCLMDLKEIGRNGEWE